MLKEVIGNKIDNLLIPEIKLDETFPLNHFVLEGFTPSWWRPNAFRGKGDTFQTITECKFFW